MPGFELATEIKATPESVWDLISDVKRYPEWITVTDRIVSMPDGPMAVGYEYEEYGGIPPFKSESKWRITEFEPNSRQVHIGNDGSMTIKYEIELVPTESGTTLVQRLDFKPRWWIMPMMLIMWPLLMGRRGRAAMRQTQLNAKKILEAAD